MCILSPETESKAKDPFSSESVSRMESVDLEGINRTRAEARGLPRESSTVPANAVVSVSSQVPLDTRWSSCEHPQKQKAINNKKRLLFLVIGFLRHRISDVQKLYYADWRIFIRL